MAALAQHAGDDGAGVRPDTRGPVAQALRTPSLDRQMCCRHVRVNGRVAAFERAAHMAGNPAATMEQLDDRDGQAHVDLLARKAVRDRVVVTADVDVIVDADGSYFPFGVLVARCRQGLHGGLVELIEHRLAAAWKFLVWPRVQPHQQGPYAAVQFIEAEEALVAQPGQYPSLRQQYRRFGFRLITGPIWTSRSTTAL